MIDTGTEGAGVMNAEESVARASAMLTGIFLALLALLHALKPEIDPSWRFISEYALGDHGWMMMLAFLALGLGCVTLAVALRPHLTGKSGKSGLLLLLINAAGLIIAAIFTTDPVTTSPGEQTSSGLLHGLGGTLGMAMPFAVGLISWQLFRNPAFASGRASIRWSAALAITGFVVSLVSLGVMLTQSEGRFGPDVPVGWPNRIEIAGYCLWLILVARQVAKVRGGERRID